MTEHRREEAPQREITLPDGRITVPPGSPKILIHTRRGKCVGIYCDQAAKILIVETRDSPQRYCEPIYLAGVELISPQMSVKVVDGYGTCIHHALAMPFDDPSMDEDLCYVLDAHDIVLANEWPDIW